MRSDHNYQSQHWKRLGARRSVANRNRCVVPDYSKPLEVHRRRRSSFLAAKFRKKFLNAAPERYVRCSFSAIAANRRCQLESPKKIRRRSIGTRA